MSQKPFLKDKKIVADFLNVSLRTINRYVQKYSLSVYSQNNEKKLDLIEILKKLNSNNLGQVETGLDNFKQFEDDYVKNIVQNGFIKGKKTGLDSLGQLGTVFQKSSTEGRINNFMYVKKQGGVEKVENVLSSNQDFQEDSEKERKEVKIYKKLYTETLADLKLKQERLEGATYRVGQLEAQIKHSVPLLTYRQKEEEVIHLSEIQKKETIKQKNKINNLEKEKREMQIMKNFYLLALFVVLVLTPLVFIYFLTQA